MTETSDKYLATCGRALHKLAIEFTPEELFLLEVIRLLVEAEFDSKRSWRLVKLILEDVDISGADRPSELLRMVRTIFNEGEVAE